MPIGIKLQSFGHIHDKNTVQEQGCEIRAINMMDMLHININICGLTQLA